MSTDPGTQRVTLYYREGSSDKVYQAVMEPSGGGFIVHFAFGRRGSTLQTGSKTPKPLDLAAARKIFDKLVQEKTAKGYSPGEEGTPYLQTAKEERASGVLPQLLNSIDETEADALLADAGWWMQEKFDGRRLLIRKSGQEVVGINRTGLIAGLPQTVVDEVRQNVAAGQCVLDGEAVGDLYHLFNALEQDGADLRPRPYADRYRTAMALAETCGTAVRIAPVAADLAGKQAMLQKLRRERKEGVVFKRHDAAYKVGRPASGGSQRKLKFTASCSCLVVGAKSAKRSVNLELLDDSGKRIAIGSVTVPQNHAIPAAGRIVEVRYLYAYPGGSLYQPVYLGERDDIAAETCLMTQLKYRATSPADEGDEV